MRMLLVCACILAFAGAAEAKGVRLSDLTWVEAKEAFKRDDVVIVLPLGASGVGQQAWRGLSSANGRQRRVGTGARAFVWPKPVRAADRVRYCTMICRRWASSNAGAREAHDRRRRYVAPTSPRPHR
jgi:hypothetical protein